MEGYKKIAKHYEECFVRNGDNCRGVDWPDDTDAQTRYRVMLNIRDYYENIFMDRDICARGENQIDTENYSVLDIGCGLGHLYEFTRKYQYKLSYTGLDISNAFIETCKNKYPDIKFICRDILTEKKSESEKYDFVIMNGVFTEKLDLNYEQMWEFFTGMLDKAFEYCTKGMAFNVMSKDVDWERDDLFHVPLNRLSSWLTKTLTRNFIIRYDYGLYEYAVYVMKDYSEFREKGRYS